jgi:hypothetical protein
MARIAQAVAPGIPHRITQQGNRRHGSGNEYGVRRIQGVKREIVSGTFLGKLFLHQPVPNYSPGLFLRMCGAGVLPMCEQIANWK